MNNKSTGCLPIVAICVALIAIICIFTEAPFIITTLIVIGLGGIVFAILMYFDTKETNKKTDILRLKEKTNEFTLQEPIMEIEKFNQKTPIFDDDHGERYEVTYDTICIAADMIREKHKCTAGDNKEIELSLKQARDYKNVRRVSELMKKDAFLRDAATLEDCIKNKSDLDIVYAKIIEDKDCYNEYGDLVKMIKEQADVDYQWAMRDAIDRMKSDCLNQITGKYANSKQHQLAMYEIFVEKIEHYRNIFEEETDEFASKAIRDIAHMTGLEYSRANVDETDDEIIDPIDEIDNMEGIAFEKVCADILSYNGFKNVEVTQGSGDQGIDVLAEKDGIKYAIQCKRYSNKLGNTPIQEVHAGRKYYKCQIGVVMTNNYFTKGAVELAEETGTLLWDRDKLIEMMENKPK